MKIFIIFQQPICKKTYYIGERTFKSHGKEQNMQDCEIISLFFDRDEDAIKETSKKYGTELLRIAKNITLDDRDAEECINDTYLAAWNAIPPERPLSLFAYLARIVRNRSCTAVETKTRKKRTSVTVELSNELIECLPSAASIEKELESAALGKLLSEFIGALDDSSQYVFMRRYFYSDSMRDISLATGFSESKLKSMLHKIRKKLKQKLEKEDIHI